MSTTHAHCNGCTEPYDKVKHYIIDLFEPHLYLWAKTCKRLRLIMLTSFLIYFM